MGMAAILLNDVDPFEQIELIRQKAQVKSGENWSSCLREEDL